MKIKRYLIQINMTGFFIWMQPLRLRNSEVRIHAWTENVRDL
jgi:hypothetical protein